MKRIILLLLGVATLTGIVAFTATTSRQVTAQEAAPIFVTQIPAGYRDWRFILVAHEAGELNDIRPSLVTIPRLRPIEKASCCSQKAQSSRE